MACKICEKPHQTRWHAQLAWQERNKDKVNAKTRRWHSLHREQVAEITRKYRKTKNGKVAILRAVKKYEAKNLKRRRAWYQARKIKLEPCEVCNKMPTHRHHPDITKPLEVVFLCPLHHVRVDMVQCEL